MKDSAVITERGTITLVRYLPGPIERVWSYLTEPKLLAKWLSDGGVANRVGGDMRFEMGATGRVTAFEPPHLLEYTWNEEEASVGPVFDSLVRWELALAGDRVQLTLTHSRLPENEVVGHGAGWHAFLDRLRASIEGRKLESFDGRYAQLKPDYVKLAASAGIRTEALPNNNH